MKKQKKKKKEEMGEINFNILNLSVCSKYLSLNLIVIKIEHTHIQGAYLNSRN